jgi:four helix bundle protein
MSSNFENLDVWKRSCRLSVQLWQLLKNSNEYWLKEQMLRSALSIPSNIAEGCERNSKAEFRRFINIAKGSAAELRTQVYIAIETGILKKESIGKFIEELKVITKMLQALINSLNR